MDNRSYYDEFADGYERHRGHGYHALLDRLELEVALRYARGARVLEAGCGTGLILKDLAPHAEHAVGIDLSGGMLARARRRGLDVAQASVTSLPFADGAFDVVCSFKVLAHVERIQVALAELSRVTRPGGHLVLEFYNPWSLRGLVKRMKPPSAISSRVDDEAVYTRYDTLDAIKGYLPPGHAVVDLRGIRVVTPVAAAYSLPGAAPLLDRIERAVCDAPVLRRLGGFLVVVARKPGGAPA